MKKLITILALGLITLGLTAQTRVRVVKNHRGSSIVNQVYHSNYSTYSHNKKSYSHNKKSCCQNLSYCTHNNRGHNRGHNRGYNRGHNRGYNNHIWVGGHWKWSRRYQDYIWVEGHWVRKRQGCTYIAGSYKLNNGIKIWISGFWR